MGATVDFLTRNFVFDADVVITAKRNDNTVITPETGYPLSNLVDGKKRTFTRILLDATPATNPKGINFDLTTARKITRVWIKNTNTGTTRILHSPDNVTWTLVTTDPSIIDTGNYEYYSFTAPSPDKRYWRIENNTSGMASSNWDIYEVFFSEYKSKFDVSVSEDDLPSLIEFNVTEPVMRGYYKADGNFVQPRLEPKFSPIIRFDKIQKSLYDTLFGYYNVGEVTNMDGELCLYLLQDHFKERMLQCVITDFNLEIDQQGIHVDPPRFSGQVQFKQSK